jgi:hypothetical protein
MNSAKPAVVKAKPGGTLAPELISSPSEAHLPPTSEIESLVHSSNQLSKGIFVAASPGFAAKTVVMRRLRGSGVSERS